MDGEVARLEGVLAQRDTWTAAQCSIDRAMRAIGNRSTLLLLREAFYGARRFDEFARRVGITEAVAAARLRELVDIGVFERQPYQEPGQRTRHEYRLTVDHRRYQRPSDDHAMLCVGRDAARPGIDKDDASAIAVISLHSWHPFCSSRTDRASQRRATCTAPQPAPLQRQQAGQETEHQRGDDGGQVLPTHSASAVSSHPRNPS